MLILLQVHLISCSALVVLEKKSRDQKSLSASSTGDHQFFGKLSIDWNQRDLPQQQTNIAIPRATLLVLLKH